jgi:hypothetical protein
MGGSALVSNRAERAMPALTLSAVLNSENGAIEKEGMKGTVFVWGSDNKG